MSLFGKALNSSIVAQVNGIVAKTPEEKALEAFEATMVGIAEEEAEWQERKEEDELAMWQLVSDKNSQTSSFIDVETIEDNVEETLENVKNMLEGQFDELVEQYGTLSNWTGVDVSGFEDKMIEMMMQPILDALMPLTDLLPELGLPKLPIIGDLNNMIKTFMAIGRIMYELPDAAQQQSQEADKEMKQGTNIWGKLGNTIMDIYELIKFAFSQIQTVLIIIGFMAVLKLLEIIKPVLDFFQLSVSVVFNMLTIAKDVANAMIGNVNALLIKLKKYFLKKVMKFVYLLEYLYRDGDGTMPIDELIRATVKDILSCTVELSAIDLQKSYEESRYVLEEMHLNKDRLEEALKQKNKLAVNPFGMANGKISIETVDKKEIEKLEERIKSLEEAIGKHEETVTEKLKNYDAVTQKEKDKYVEYMLSSDKVDYVADMEKSFLEAVKNEKEAKKKAMAESIQMGIAKGTTMAGGQIKGSIASSLM